MKKEKYVAYVGTYTHENSVGIHIYDVDVAKTLAGLKSAEGFIRSKLAKTVNLRNTPEIRFVLDQSIEYGVKMSKMIDEVTKDIKSEDDAEE